MHLFDKLHYEKAQFLLVLFLEGKHLSAAETAPANKTRAHIQSLSKIKREGIINLLLLH